MRTVKAVPMPEKPWRWIIIDPATGEILDDAQGFGYKTAPKAHAAWAYHHPSPHQAHARKTNQKLNREFVKTHHKFLKNWDDFVLAQALDQTPATYQDFKQFLHEVAPDFAGKPYSLYLYIQKHA